MFSESAFETDYTLSKDMIGTSILSFILFLIILRSYFYLRHHRMRNQRSLSATSNSLTTPTFTEERLDPTLLKSLPIFTYSSSAVRATFHECAICLSEYTDGDECRMLPNCSHVFHYQCIDGWFTSHSNCPLCRTPVQPVTVDSQVQLGFVSGSEGSGEGNSNFPEPIGCPRRPFRVIVEFPREVFPMESHIRGC